MTNAEGCKAVYTAANSATSPILAGKPETIYSSRKPETIYSDPKIADRKLSLVTRNLKPSMVINDGELLWFRRTNYGWVLRFDRQAEEGGSITMMGFGCRSGWATSQKCKPQGFGFRTPEGVEGGSLTAPLLAQEGA